MNFTIFKNFYLEVKTSNWGEAQIQDIIKLLDSVITEFYSIFDNCKIFTFPVVVLRTTQGYSEIIKEKDIILIYLDTFDTFWAQYSYQFSHELCHYIINTEFPPKNDSFGWLEETLCELASLYTLNKMSITWKTNPPYPSWKDYSICFKKYVDDKISEITNKNSQTFSLWLKENISDLYINRYKRTENLIIAIQLLPLFTESPELWKIILYINNITVFDGITLEQYLLEWRKLIPSNLYSNFDKIMTILNFE